MAIVRGTVEGVNLKYKPKIGLLMDNGKWYNGNEKFVPDIKSVRKGSVVEFDDGGKNYVNDLTIVSGGSSMPATSASTSKSSGSGYSRGAFPIPQDDGQRSIIRQNALTNARELYAEMLDPDAKPSFEDATAEIISIAMRFEEYTTGDLDAFHKKLSDD